MKIEKFGLMVIIIVFLSTMRLNMNSVMFICTLLTLLAQYLLSFDIKKNEYLLYDIFIRLTIDILVLYKLNPKNKLIILYFLARITLSCLELTILVTNNLFVFIAYIFTVLLSIYILYMVLDTKKFMKYAIIFTFPFFMFNYLGNINYKILATTSNIFNKSLYIFALNEIFKIY